MGAQRIAVHIIDGSWNGVTSTQLAELMGKSLSSVSGYLAELSSVDPSLVGSRGRTRFLVSPQGALARKELLEKLEVLLSSPVRKRLFLVLNDTGCSIFKGFVLSGVSALSKRTMLADDPWETRAVAASDKEIVERLLSEAEQVTRYDSPDALLELWGYEPREDDAVSLYLDVKSLAAAEHDDRLDAAVEDLKEAMFA